jgi:predicted RNA-binding Zn-ribbon protein involved in translation (DUF1610 family)
MAIRKEKHKPAKVIRVSCPKCGELMVKIYPWSSYNLPEAAVIPWCKKCRNADDALSRRAQVVQKIKSKRGRTLKSGVT